MKAQKASELEAQANEKGPLDGLMAQTRRTFMYAGLFSLAINVLMLGLPIYSLQVLDRVISSHSIETLVLLTIIVVIGFIFHGIFTVIRTYTLNSVCEWLDHILAPKLLSDAVVKASLGVQVNAAQYQRDLGTIKSFISGGGLTTLLDAPWSVIFIFVIYLINPILGMLAVIGVVVLIGFGLINEFATRKPLESAMRLSLQSQQMADMAGRNAEAIESMGMMKNIQSVWSEQHRAAMEKQNYGTRRSVMIQSLSRVVRMILQIAVTGIGGYLALNNELTVGGMIASSILVGRALAPFEGAIMLWKSWITTREAYQRMNHNLKMRVSLERGTIELPEPDGNLTVEGLVFAPPRTPAIIKGLNFDVKPGESLGIIGPSAAGKSTLSKLIVGLLPPSQGSVRLDGAETFKWNRENFGKYVGYLPQNVELFSGSIKDNVARMDVNATVEGVIEASKRAGAHELILRLPNGYETECGDRNLNLSPGQRQRIGLARALYGRPKFVLLDEPNSNLDGDGERALVEALTRMKQDGVTFIVVAHRPTIVSMVDKLLVLRGGSIEKFGTRAEILQQYTAGGRPAAPGKGGA